MNGLRIAHVTPYDLAIRGGSGKTAAAIASWLPRGSAVLQVAPGPGFLAIELAKLGCMRLGRLNSLVTKLIFRTSGVGFDLRVTRS